MYTNEIKFKLKDQTCRADDFVLKNLLLCSHSNNDIPPNLSHDRSPGRRASVHCAEEKCV